MNLYENCSTVHIGKYLEHFLKQVDFFIATDFHIV